MKYEAVFGDQSLFDGCYYETASIVIATSNGKKFVAGEFTEYGIVEGDVKSDGLRIAMRRIIAEPKRWTVEDKKAGRLPEVGAEYNVDGCIVEHLGVGAVCCENIFYFKYPSGACGNANERSAIPIETPEEKAQRLEDEFVNELMKDGQVIYTSSEQLAMCRKTARAAYRKLSGALSAPTKGGE